MLRCMERGIEGFGRCPVLITTDHALIEQVLRMAAAVAVEIDVHADFARAAQRQENQFVTWFHVDLYSFLVRFAPN